MQLVISSLEDKDVKGSLEHYGKDCRGTYAMAGTLEGNALKMESTHKGGRLGECKMKVDATVEGGSITGTLAPDYTLSLTK